MLFRSPSGNWFEKCDSFNFSTFIQNSCGFNSKIVRASCEKCVCVPFMQSKTGSLGLIKDIVHFVCNGSVELSSD